MLVAAALAVAVGASAKDGLSAASAPGASAPTAAPAKKPVKSSALKVVVTGDGKPVNSAEVTLKPAAGDEVKRFTNADGEANFSVPSGPATVRVIATGWASKLREVTVADGNPKAEIVLEH
jgi:hypothetical protein